MVDLRKLKDKAAELVARGKLEKAAELYREAVEADPRDVGTRQKLAEVLRRAGRIPEAIEVYRQVADRYGRDGLLIKAIAISKTILELDPEHVETQSSLAALYSRKAELDGIRPPPRQTLVMAVTRPRPDGAPPAPPRPAAMAPSEPVESAVAIPLVPPAAPESADAEAIAIPLDVLVEPETASSGASAVASDDPFQGMTAFQEIVFAADEAIEAGVAEDVVRDPEPIDVDVADDEPLTPSAAPEPQPPAPHPAPAADLRLPQVPIFSDLSKEAFVELMRGMVLHRPGCGEVVIREGETGTSFYVIATGRLAVSKRDDRGDEVVLARLGEGSFFGEMALLSGAPRAATVTADEPSEILEFRAGVLLAIARRHPHLAASLRRFYRQRLLANAMAVSPVFRPFPRGDRKLIMERFRAREVRGGEVVVRAGEPSDGLYVVLDGAVDVVTYRDGREVLVGHLREGDVFGEMSCLRKAPASATVVVRRAGTLLRLPRKDFDDLVVTYPQILELVSELSEERSENLDAILSGRAEWTEDGLVLI